MRTLYSLALYLLTPVFVLRLLWRSLRAPAYRQRIAERFGRFVLPELQDTLWVHAVSVGETLAAVPLIRALQDRYPGRSILVTTTTPTGSARVQEIFGESVAHVYAPYDLPGSVRLFLDKAQPRVAIVMETEIWPNLFQACRTRGIPVLLANARLSESSARGYGKLRNLTRKTLQCITRIAAQGEADAERFLALGANREQVSITGSIKFDLSLPASLLEQAQVLRRDFGLERAIWIAASTHEGEEDQVLAAFAQVRKSLPATLLILVPRHPERFARVIGLCRRSGYRLAVRSENEMPDAQTDIYIGDTMGELNLLYAAADVAFVGGSLVPVGGHNVLEAAALGIPTVVGPHMFNFDEISRRLLERNAMLQVQNAGQLASQVEMLLRDPNLRYRMGEQAREFVEQNRGALERLLRLIRGMEI